MSRKEVLQKEIETYNQLIADHVGNPEKQAEIATAELEWRRNELRAIEDTEAQTKRVEEAYTGRIADSQAEAGVTLENIEISGVKFRHLIGSDDDYILACSMVNQVNAVQAEKFSLAIKGYEEREIQLQRQNGELQKDLGETTKSRDEAAKLATTLKDELTEAQQNRDNAANQLEEARAEIQRLEAKVDEQRKEMANGVRGEIKTIDIEADKARAEKARLEKTIYNVIPDSEINPKSYTATKALTGESFTFNWTLKNGFIILTDQAQIEEFKANQPQTLDLSNVFKAISPVEEPEHSFQEVETVSSVEPGNGQEVVDGSGQAEGNAATQSREVSREEFEALKADVETLKNGARAAA